MSNDNNHFSRMTTFEQWNYGDGQRGIFHRIKKGIISYEKSARSSIYYTFAHHPQARLLCNDLLTKTIDFLRKLAPVVEDLYHPMCLKCFGSQGTNKEARDIFWNIVTTLLVFLSDKLCAVRVVSEDAFNYPDRANKIYLWGVLQDHRVMLEFVK